MFLVTAPSLVTVGNNMFTFRGNVGKIIRELGALTSGPNSIYKKAGEQLKDQLLEEFDSLVRETPQWTGTTAASWEIGFPSNISGDVETQPERTRVEALQRGAEPACSIATRKARRSLTGDFKKIATQDIIVANSAPGFETAEEGPVRPDNTPPGALSRFEGRVAAMEIEVDFYK